jgi:hypothetical protein
MASKSTYAFVGQDKVTPELQKINKSLEKFSQTAKNLGKTVGGAFAVDKIKDFAVESYKAFANKEVVLNRFGEAMRRAGGAVSENMKRFSELADNLERTAGIDDNEILNLASKFVTLGRSSEEVEKLIKVGADLSALTGGDLSSSLDMLTKADMGNVKALKILIPELGNLTEEQIKNGDAVDIVGEKVQGMSEKVYGGGISSINNLSASFEELQETVGDFLSGSGGILDWVTNLTNGLTEAIKKMNEMNTASQSINPNASAQTKRDILMQRLEVGKTMLRDNTLTAGEATAAWDMMGTDWYKRTGNPLEDFRIYIERQLPNQLRALQDEIGRTTPSAPIPRVSGGGGGTKKAGGNSNAESLMLGFGPGTNEYYGQLVESGYDWLEIERMATDEKEKQKKLLEEAEQLTKDNIKNTWDTFNVGVNAVTSFYDTWSKLAQEQEQEEINRLKNRQEEEKNTYELQRKLKENLGEDLTAFDEAYANSYLTTQAEIAQREKEAKKKAFESNKATSIVNAIMGTANAVVNALTLPYPYNFIQAGIVGALGAGQVGLIASQPTPQFADGGVVFPNGDSQGRLVRVAEKEPEWILNGKQMDNLISRKSGGGAGAVVINVSGAVYGSLETMTKEINKTLTSLKREGKI